MKLPFRTVSDQGCTKNFEALEQAVPGPGEMRMWVLSTAPPGWAIADGSACPEGALRSLLLADGSPHGTSGGVPLLPNMKGRVPVGRDAAQAEFDVLGETGGAKTHTLLTAEMPSHTHTQDPHSHGGQTTSANRGAHVHSETGWDYAWEGVNSPVNSTSGRSGAGNRVYDISSTNSQHDHSIGADTATNQSTGGGGPHNNMQPYLAINFIIKT